MSRKTRNLIWSVPLVATLAIVGALAFFMTLTPNDASAQSALADEPGTPLNLIAVKDGPTRIELSWEKPADGGNPEFYRVDWSADGKVWRALVPEKNDPGYVDRGLLALETRHYRILAVNSNGTGPVSNVATETTETTNRPDRPEDLTAAVLPAAPVAGPVDAIDDGDFRELREPKAIITKWDAPDDPEGAPIVGYLVEVSSDDGAWGILMPDTRLETTTFPNGDMLQTGAACTGADFCYIDNGLKERESRYYRVYSLNVIGGQKGPGDVSTSAFAKTRAGDLPPAPRELAASVKRENSDSREIWLYWEPPHLADDALPVTGYLVQGRPVPLVDLDGDPLTELTISIESADYEDWSESHILVQDNKTTDVLITESILGKVPNTSKFTTWQFRVFSINSAWDYVDQHYTDGTDDEFGKSRRAIGLTSSVPALAPAPAPADLPGNAAYVLVTAETDDAPGVPTSVDAEAYVTANEVDARTAIKLIWSEPDETGNNDDANNALDWRIEVTIDDNEWKRLYPYLPLSGLGVDDTDAPAMTTIYHPQPGTGDEVGKMVFVHHYDIHTDDGVVDTDTDRDDTLLARDQRKYRVSAVSAPAGGTTPVLGWRSDQVTASTAPAARPTPPQTLTATPKGRTQIVLKWARPSYDGNARITHYRLQRSDDGDDWNTLDDVTVVGSKTTYTDLNLLPSQTRYYRVFASNVDHESDSSGSKSATTEPVDAPDAPNGLVAIPTDATTMHLLWNAVSDDPSDAPVTGYRVHYSETSTGDRASWPVAFEDTEVVYTEAMVTGLMAETKYYFAAFARNIAGAGHEVSNTDSASTLEATAPGAPTGLSATAASETQIDLGWMTPTETGGADITGYIIERAYGDVMFLDHADADGDAFSDAESWWNGLGCEAMVEAVNDDRPADEETNPFCKMYDGIVAEADRMTVDEYFAKRYVVTGDTMTTYMDMDLMQDTEYMYRVKAVNAVGAGMWSNTAMATTEATDTAPGMPTAVMTEAMSDTHIRVSWTAPTDNGGATITGYMVESAYMMADGTMSDWMAVDPAHTGMAMTYMDTGLMPETMYYYQVRAMNAAGNGEWSDGMASAMTMATGTDLTPPSGVVMSSLRDTVSVTWDPASIENADQVKVVLFDSGVTTIVYLETFNAANDPDAATFTDVDSGTYKVTVASFRTGDRHKLSALMEVTVE